MLKEQWPEGGQDILKVTQRPHTTATIFKNSMVSLVDNLMKKVRQAKNKNSFIKLLRTIIILCVQFNFRIF